MMGKSSRFVKESEKIFEGVRFDIHATEITDPSGKSHRREAVVHPGAVVILPLLSENEIILIRNERFAVGETLWELPAGTLEPDEAPEETAKRELLEETGYECEELFHLVTFYTTPGYCNEIMFAFAAEGLSYKEQNLDEAEKIEVELVSWHDALKLCREGKIRDGKTLATLLYYKSFA